MFIINRKSQLKHYFSMFLLVLTLFLFAVSKQSFSQETEQISQDIIKSRTATTDTYRTSNGFKTIYYSNVVNIPSDGTYKPLEEVVNVSWQDGNLVYSWYDKEIRLRPLVIYNGNPYTIQQIKAIYPNLDLKSMISRNRGSYKWAFNITNIPDAIKNNINYIVFELVGAKNLTWDDVSIDDHTLYLPDNIKVSYQDLLDSGFTLSLVNKTYLLIGNVAGKNELFLDPTVTYNYSTGINNMWAWDAGNDVGCPGASNVLHPSCLDTNITANSALDASDDVRELENYAPNASMLFIANTSITISDITLINWTWEGQDTGIAGNLMFYLWNVSSSSYNLVGSDAGGGTDVVLSFLETNSSQFVNSSGYTHFLVQQGNSVTAYLLTDFVKLEITYNGLIINSPISNQEILNSLSTNLNTSQAGYNNTIWYTWNKVKNYTLCTDSNECQETITFSRQGYYNLTVYANKSDGTVTSKNVNNLFVGNRTQFFVANDTYVVEYTGGEDSPTKNYGDRTSLRVYYNSPWSVQMLLFFNTTLTNTIIKNTTLYLYKVLTDGYAGYINISNITSDWSENAVTWNTRPSYNSNSLITFYSGTSIEWVLITSNNLSNILKSTDNKGFLFSIKSPTAFNQNFSSREGTEANKPYLNITYYSLNMPPNVSIFSPSNLSKINSTGINFTFNITDDNDYLKNISLYINSTFNSTMSNQPLNVSINNTFHFNITNVAYGTYSWYIETYDSDSSQSVSNIQNVIINSPPSITGVELNKTSGVISTDILKCLISGISDINGDNTSSHYEWYNNSIKTSWDIENSTNLTGLGTWYCEGWISDGFLNSSKFTSTTIIVGSSEVAPSIITVNATTDITGINSTTEYPTNNNTWINISVQISDPNANTWTSYFCNTPTYSDCRNNVSNSIICKSDNNISIKSLSCMYNASGYSGVNPLTIYGFIEDSISLHSSAKSTTFEVNNPPNIPILVYPANDAYINTNYTLLNWTATDPNSDTMNYTLYLNLTGIFEFFYNGTVNSNNFSNATTEYRTYYWRVYVQDMHSYGFYNITMGNFTTDFTNPNMTVTSPVHDTIYNTESVSLIISAEDNFINLCNYTLFYKDTDIQKESNTAGCSGTTALTTPYYSGGYKIDVYSYDKAGNSRSTEINFTTESLSASTAGSGGGGEQKKWCNITVVPDNLTFKSTSKVIRLDFINNEKNSISPSYSIDTNVVEIKGLIELSLVPNQPLSVSLVRTKEISKTVNANLKIVSSTCNDIIIPMTIEPESSLTLPVVWQGNFIDTIKYIYSNLKTTVLSPIIGKLLFLYVVVFYMVLITFVMVLAKGTKLVNKIFGGLFMVLLLSYVTKYVVVSLT